MLVTKDGHVVMTGKVLRMSDRLGANAKIKLIRFTPDFPRLGGLFKSKDVWVLVGVRVPHAKLKQLAQKSSRIEDLKNVKEGWLTKEIAHVLSSDSTVRYKNLSRVYEEIPGSLIF